LGISSTGALVFKARPSVSRFAVDFSVGFINCH
jgi:hypothetical protein